MRLVNWIKNTICRFCLHTRNPILQQQMDQYGESNTSQPAEQSSQTREDRTIPQSNTKSFQITRENNTNQFNHQLLKQRNNKLKHH